MSKLTNEIKQTLAERRLTPYRVGKLTRWGPSYVYKVLSPGGFYLGPKRLAHLMDTLGLTQAERRRWMTAAAMDEGAPPDACVCPTCQLVRRYMPELLKVDETATGAR